jgi:hypothetical protein
MSRAEQYTRYAEECLRIARTTSSSAEKMLMLEMAHKWRELADKAMKGEDC